MFLIEILLPVKTDGSGDQIIQDVSKALTARFGGATSFLRAPGEGAWRSGGSIVKDQIVVVEVMTDQVDRAWWREFRNDLEARLKQQEIVIRSHEIERL